MRIYFSFVGDVTIKLWKEYQCISPQQHFKSCFSTTKLHLSMLFKGSEIIWTYKGWWTVIFS